MIVVRSSDDPGYRPWDPSVHLGMRCQGLGASARPELKVRSEPNEVHLRDSETVRDSSCLSREIDLRRDLRATGTVARNYDSAVGWFKTV